MKAARLALIAALAGLAATTARAEDIASDSTLAAALHEAASPAPAVVSMARAKRAPLIALVPEIAEHPYRLESGSRPFLNRLSFSPAWGNLGINRLFLFRIAYNPNDWLGYEASIAHSPGDATHAVLHTVSAVVRKPFPGRLQPYLTGGYGMIVVHPGRSVNADPVTKNAVSLGGGLELYIRSDLALRGEMRRATVFGRQRDRDGVVAYDYLQETIGLAFYRTIRP